MWFSFQLPVLPLHGGVRGGLLLQPLNRVFILDDLDGVGLCEAGRNELEGGLVTEVLELLARFPADVHLLDVLGRELIDGACAFGLEFAVERAQVSELHLLALEHHLAEAGYGVGEDAIRVFYVYFLFYMCPIAQLIVLCGHFNAFRWQS